MIELDEKRMNELSKYVYRYILERLEPPCRADEALSEQDIHVVRMMAATCSMAVPAVLSFLKEQEDCERAPSSRFQS